LFQFTRSFTNFSLLLFASKASSLFVVWIATGWVKKLAFL